MFYYIGLAIIIFLDYIELEIWDSWTILQIIFRIFFRKKHVVAALPSNI